MNLFKYLLIYLLLLSTNLMAFSLFKNYSNLPPDQNVQDLVVEQINNPTDPYINYNLGVALYKTEKFYQAKSNFQRCLIHAKNKKLKERGYFNLANSFYKNGLSMLPVNWSNKDVEVDQTKLTQSIQEVKDSIKNYENLLEINKKNIHGTSNLKKAKDTLKVLQEKMKQQQQNQQDKKDKSDQNQDQKQDQQNQKTENKDQDNNPQQRQPNQDSSRDSKERDNKQNQQQQPTQDKKDSSSQPDDKRAGRDQKKSDQGKDQNEKQQDLKHDDGQSNQEQEQQQNNQQHGNQSGQQKQEQAEQASIHAAQKGDNKQETAKQKAMRAILDNLQNYESNLQKVRVIQKTQDTQKPLKSNQKPW
ncbi:MAG: von Willebrand factor type A [candidate division TM6 bacterium GW2011_GWF2_37_49]|nr:MAG: von Willebrand factor type A [candidate division TM6 bacterium GW2011_GWF2_37_49]